MTTALGEIRDLLSADVDRREIVIDRKTGRPRQAGASQAEGAYMVEMRRRFEKSPYAFAKGVLARDRLTPELHKPTMDWLTVIPPYRKLGLLPRDHYKSTMVSQVLPCHVFIQPRETNIYFPGKDGVETRILLTCETETRASMHLRWVENQFERNDVLRGFWPHRLWENPRRESKKWNETQMLLPRATFTDTADSSMQAVGVGGAITGGHFDVLIKDDLISIEAANSPLVMETAIEWHKTSRALMDDPDKSLEFIIGTRWAVRDLYSVIQETDPSVAVLKKGIIENGKPIMPKVFSLATIARLHKEFGVLFPLLYMNEAADPELTDFDMTMIREFEIVGGNIVFKEDERDALIAERMNAPMAVVEAPSGMPLTRDTWQLVYQPGQGLRRFVSR